MVRSFGEPMGEESVQESKSVESKEARAYRPSPTARKILSFIEQQDGAPCSKAAIAANLGCVEKTVDRLVSKLRRAGLVEVVPMWDERGGQLANSYRLAAKE